MEIETIVAIIVAVVIAGLLLTCKILYSQNQSLNQAMGTYKTQEKVLTDTLKNKDADIDTCNTSIKNLTDLANSRAANVATAVDQAKKSAVINTTTANKILASSSTHVATDKAGQSDDTNALIDGYIADRKARNVQTTPTPTPAK